MIEAETGWIARISAFCIRRRVAVVCVLGLATLILTYFAALVEVKTVFSDMLPS